MARIPLAVVLLLTSLTLAGCLGDDTPGADAPGDGMSDAKGDTVDDPPQGTSDDDGTKGGAMEGEEGNETASGNATNTPPEATITTDLDGGEAPLTVNFTFEATDADNDTLSWEIDLDGDGAADEDGIGGLPVNASWTYEEAGNVTVTFTVFDAEISVNATVVIQVRAPIDAGDPESMTFSGSVVSPDPFAVSGGLCVMPLADFAGSGTWGQVYAAPDGIDGWAFSLDHAAAVATFLAGDTPGSSGNSGTVSNGATDIMVCATEPLVDYVLTLSPS